MNLMHHVGPIACTVRGFTVRVRMWESMGACEQYMPPEMHSLMGFGNFMPELTAVHTLKMSWFSTSSAASGSWPACTLACTLAGRYTCSLPECFALQLKAVNGAIHSASAQALSHQPECLHLWMVMQLELQGLHVCPTTHSKQEHGKTIMEIRPIAATPESCATVCSFVKMDNLCSPVLSAAMASPVRCCSALLQTSLCTWCVASCVHAAPQQFSCSVCPDQEMADPIHMHLLMCGDAAIHMLLAQASGSVWWEQQAPQ